MAILLGLVLDHIDGGTTVARLGRSVSLSAWLKLGHYPPRGGRAAATRRGRSPALRLPPSGRRGFSLLHDHPPPRQHEDKDEEDQRDNDLRLTLVAPQARHPLPYDDLQPHVHAAHLPHYHPHPRGRPVRRDLARTAYWTTTRRPARTSQRTNRTISQTMISWPCSLFR